MACPRRGTSRFGCLALLGAAFLSFSVPRESRCSAATPATLPCLSPRIVDLPREATSGDYYYLVPFGDGHGIVLQQRIAYVNTYELIVYFAREIIAAAAGLVALVTLLRLRRLVRRRRVPGEPYCRKCGYQLTGLTSDRCPECGVESTPRNRVIARSIRRPAIVCSAILSLAAAVGIAPQVMHLNRFRKLDERYQRTSVWLAEWVQGRAPSSPLQRLLKHGVSLIEVDATNGKILRRLEPAVQGKYDFQRLVVSGDGWSLLCSQNHKIRRWDLHTSQLVGTCESKDFTCYPCVNDMAMDDQRVYGCGRGEQLLSWDLRSGAPTASWHVRDIGISDLCAMPTAHRVAVRVLDAIVMLDPATGKQRTIENVTRESLMPWTGTDGPFVWSATQHDGHTLMQVHNGLAQSVASLEIRDGPDDAFLFSRDRRLCVAAPDDFHASKERAAIYDLHSKRRLFDLDVTQWTGIPPVFTADGCNILVLVPGRGPNDKLLVYDLPKAVLPR